MCIQDVDDEEEEEDRCVYSMLLTRVLLLLQVCPQRVNESAAPVEAQVDMSVCVCVRMCVCVSVCVCVHVCV